MTSFTVKWSAAKGAKKLAKAQPAFVPGEEVWFLGVCNNLRPMANTIAVTPLRVVALQDDKVVFSVRHADITDVSTDARKGAVEVTSREGQSMTFKLVPAGDLDAIEGHIRQGRENPAPAELVAAADGLGAESSERQAAAKARHWPHSTVRGKLSRDASEAILRQCHGGEQPDLILTSRDGGGTLVTFEDRLAIIKAGTAAAAAGATLGERSAVFHYADITGIEYNSGLAVGVLEILTPSYDGSANKDFWRGRFASRNADSNSPFTLSNCLPLSKAEYQANIGEIQKLKQRISQAKRPAAPPPAAAPAAPAEAGLAEQLEKLGGLHSAGVLSDEEFAAAKARLLS